MKSILKSFLLAGFLMLLFLLAGSQSLLANLITRWDFTSGNFLKQLELSAGKRFADPEVTIGSPVNGAESASPANGSFTVFLNSTIPVTEDVTVTYTVSGTATDGADYTIQTSVNIPAGTPSAPLPVSVLDDMILEPNETVTVTLLSATTTTSGTVIPVSGSSTLIITDDDYNTVSRNIFLEDPVNGEEGGTNGAIKMSLPSGYIAGEDITVYYKVTGSLPPAKPADSDDYSSFGLTAVIKKGMSSATVNIPIVDDAKIEGEESFEVELLSATGATGSLLYGVGPNIGVTVAIIDNDNTVAITSITDGEEDPSNTKNAAFYLSLPAGIVATEDVRITYTLEGDAENGIDYTTLSGSFIIPVGNSGASLQIPITDDKVIENKEDIRLKLVSGTGVTSGMAFTFITADNVAYITDNDNIPANRVLTITNITDGAEPNINGSFRISLPAGYTCSEGIALIYTISGSATNIVDYKRLIGTATLIPAGQNSTDPILVEVINDLIIEGDEKAIFTISSGRTLSATPVLFTPGTPAVGTVTIADDDNTDMGITVAATDPNAAEPNDNGTFTITLPGGKVASVPVTVNYTITGTATNGTDYTTIPLSVIIPAGASSIPVPVTVQNDNLIEGNETVILTITSATSAITSPSGFVPGTPAVATVNIVDDDNADMNVVATASDPNAAEPSDNGAFNISIAPGKLTGVPITVTYTITGTAEGGKDYTSPPLTALIPLNGSSVSIPVSVIDDNLIEGAETVILTITGVTSTPAITPLPFTYDPAKTATVTIADDDNTDMNIVATASDASAKEPSDNGEFKLSIAPGKLASVPIVITYTITGTATNGTDYTTIPLTATIPAGANSVPVSVPVLNDELVEGDENVILTITAVDAPFTFNTTNTATVIIADDDNTTVDIGDQDGDASNGINGINAAEPNTNGSFTLSLAPGKITTMPVVITYTISGTAANGTDYTTLPLTATINPGDNKVDVLVNVIDDDLIEGDETVILTIDKITTTLPITTGTQKTASIIIKDDDDSDMNVGIGDNDGDPSNGINGVNAAEPNKNGGFTVGIAPGKKTSVPIVITYTITGTAINGTDYVNASGTVTINAGSNSAEIPVTVIDDNLIEGDETVTVKITGISSPPLPFVIGTQNTAGIIIEDDDDNADMDVVATASDPDAAEPSNNGEFKISIAPGKLTGVPITVTYTITGTAEDGKDYTSIPLTAIIPVNGDSYSIPVTVIDDILIESPETVILTITGVSSVPSLPFTYNATSTAIVTIKDNDNTDLNIMATASDASAAEPSNNGEFKLSMAPGKLASVPIVITYTITGTAKDGLDYTSIPLTATIPVGENSVPVSVPVLDDNLIEGDEKVILTITAVDAPFTFTATTNTATVTIADDDITTVDIGDQDGDASNGINGINAAEPNTNGSFTLSFAPGKITTLPVVITYTISGTAANGTDYTSLPLTTTIAAGENSVPVPVTVIDDDLIEGTETVILTIDKITTTLPITMGTQKTASIIIKDDDDTDMNVGIGDNDGDASNGINGVNAAEPNKNGGFTVSVAPGKKTSVPINITYTITGTALNGTDYRSVSGTVRIEAGNNGAEIPVTVIDDNLIEGDETVTVAITGISSPPLPFVIGTRNTAGIIIDDDDDTDMSVGPEDNDGDASNGINGMGAAEPDKNGGFKVRVAPGKLTSVPITISYTLSGTATSGEDYETPPAEVTIAAGEGDVAIPVKVIDDKLVEGDENVILTITGVNGSPLPFMVGTNNTASVNVVDNDQPKVDLVVTKTVVQPAPYIIGQDITYRITVTNNGNVPATEVVMTDNLPGAIELNPVTATLKGLVNQNGSIVTWEIGQLEIGETVEMTMVCHATDGGSLVNTASAVAKENEDKPEDNKAVATISVEGDVLIIPNVFTPNGDGKNEMFDIGGLKKYPSASLYVYNRWGAMVYQSKDYQNNWSGTGLNAGSYFYTLEVKKADGTKIYKGWVEILR
ncbi:gliding motility-associated C-terminal domain-containing protein [Chitinophaga sp. CF118]|uniref:Calx-beta domain-containing protein n=1 Tax=Chitinophaga sp. CF118 TaxID=1884367 RepID=UPI0008E87A00|nr:Calx-beta domain-containing protein [Chitinophaga sp. CF118]SFE16272.1 gliding motility-associated C-terminal domain-containing protein [Chitinophaga sp. CF118]